jgi:AcrR family transcriptional regulator
LKDKIIAAAARVLLREGLQGWSVDLVAAEAGCAKGLIHYHHGSKKELLGRVAGRLDRERQARRLAALTQTGPEALDRLWSALEGEIRNGAWAAWAALSAEPDIIGPTEAPAEVAAFGAAVAGALEIPALSPEDTRLVVSALDGFQLALVRGAPRDAVREAYHRLWLALLP